MGTIKRKHGQRASWATEDSFFGPMSKVAAHDVRTCACKEDLKQTTLYDILEVNYYLWTYISDCFI